MSVEALGTDAPSPPPTTRRDHAGQSRVAAELRHLL
jgi:hypothetical protein